MITWPCSYDDDHVIRHLMYSFRLHAFNHPFIYSPFIQPIDSSDINILYSATSFCLSPHTQTPPCRLFVQRVSKAIFLPNLPSLWACPRCPWRNASPCRHGEEHQRTSVSLHKSHNRLVASHSLSLCGYIEVRTGT